jgi:hypothetical protein
MGILPRLRQIGKRRKSPINEAEYGLVDKVSWLRGLMDVFNVVYPQLEDLDFTTQAAELEVPVYFFVGRYDVNAMASLVSRVAQHRYATAWSAIAASWIGGSHRKTA